MLGDVPSFMSVDFLLIVLSSALGAFMLWVRWGQKNPEFFILTNFIALFCEKNTLKARRLEFFLFIALGCTIGIIMVQPVTLQQAFAAGLGWTSFCVNTKKI